MANNLTFNLQNIKYWSPEVVGDQYELKILKKMQTRRMTKMAKVAIDLALQSVESGTIDYLVYASRHGELILSTDLINSILGGEIPSPIKFSQSTHNSIAGLFSLSHKAKSPMTAISAGENSLVMGLTAAAAYLKNNQNHKVLFIFADAKLPGLYEKLSGENDFAFSSLMVNGNDYQIENSELESQSLSSARKLLELVGGDESTIFGQNFKVERPRK